MAVYLITWDLNREKPNYANARARVIRHLERYEHRKDPGLDSAWFVDSSATAQQINDDLRQVFDDNDRFMITKLSPASGTDHQGWLSQHIWDWINTRL